MTRSLSLSLTHLHLEDLADTFVRNDIRTYIHTLMAVAAVQGARHIRSSLGFSILPKDTLT